MSKMSRRKFLKNGAKGAALVSIPVFFSANPVAAILSSVGGELTLNDYYNLFKVDESIIHKIMSIALERGGDYSDLYFQHRISNTINLEDNLVSRANTNVDLGVGIRVIKGDQTGYSYTEDLSLKSMSMAAKTAANIANGTKTVAPVELKLHDTPNYYLIDSPWEEVNADKKIPLLQKVNDRMLALDNRVTKVQVFFSDDNTHMMVANSDGRIVFDYQPMTRMFAFCSAEQDGRREENFYRLGGRYGIDHYTDANLNRIAKTAVDRTVTLFDAVKPEGGEMEVVLAAGEAGIILHEAIGHGMEADFNRKGESLFADKIGKKIAEDFVTIVDDGTLPNMRGTINVDDEGNDSHNTVLVENGILKSYMHDHISSKHYEVKPTGNGRRQSFRHVPVPRMTNTYMLKGPHTKEEIIGSVKKGLYAEAFTNGEVNIGPGDFTFYLKSGYLIEDGKITRPVKDVNIIGNGPQVLKDFVMVGDDPQIGEGGGTCGKSGQGAPVTDGMPTTKVSKITVGGVS